jgi:hypothetical protein
MEALAYLRNPQTGMMSLGLGLRTTVQVAGLADVSASMAFGGIPEGPTPGPLYVRGGCGWYYLLNFIV